jgi:hypothetical protein
VAPCRLSCEPSAEAAIEAPMVEFVLMILFRSGG